MEFTSVNKIFENSFKKNWDRPAISNYRGETLHYKDVARRMEKLHIMFEECGLQKGDTFGGIHEQCRSAGRREHRKRMVAERKHGISAGQDPLVPEMDAVKKSDRQFHAVRKEWFAIMSGRTDVFRRFRTSANLRQEASRSQ